jgi:hypothetical protein
MEPRNYEKPSESGNANKILSQRPEGRKPRFRLVKLEERVAPANARSYTPIPATYSRLICP